VGRGGGAWFTSCSPSAPGPLSEEIGVPVIGRKNTIIDKYIDIK